MDRLDGSASVMLVSDLDFTMVDHGDPENLSLLRFNALWEAYYRTNSLLVFSTGRSPTIYQQLKNEKPLLTPDVTILSVGTEIMYGPSMVRDYEWDQYLNHGWNRNIVTEETNKFPELIPQAETEQRHHKVSFYVDKIKALEIKKSLLEILQKRGVDAKIICSNGTAFDVLPKYAGKGQALEYLLKTFEANRKMPGNTLVCGDSGNDAELFGVPRVYGVMVSNAQEELLQWHTENTINNPRIIHSTERCAVGIIHALGIFSLGPNVSPRDIRDFRKCKAELLSPSYEVVKFYLFYERWMRGDVEKSNDYLEDLRLSLFPLGTFVHPSGVEQSTNYFIDRMIELYGCKRGKQYRVWVDHVSSSQVSSDTWLLKFFKWESSEGERRCCLTTSLLSSKANLRDGFTWMHMHQTWIDGSASGATTTASTSTAPTVFGSSSGSVFNLESLAIALPPPQQQPVFGSTPPSSSPYVFGGNNNDQMNMEDSMAEDTIQANTSTAPPVFGQQPVTTPPSFVFGSATTPAGGNQFAPTAANPFQFGGQPNLAAPQNPSPFQASGSLEFSTGGSFSLGTGGDDKSNRKFVRVSRKNPRQK